MMKKECDPGGDKIKDSRMQRINIGRVDTTPQSEHVLPSKIVYVDITNVNMPLISTI